MAGTGPSIVNIATVVCINVSHRSEIFKSSPVCCLVVECALDIVEDMGECIPVFLSEVCCTLGEYGYGIRLVQSFCNLCIHGSSQQFSEVLLVIKAQTSKFCGTVFCIRHFG
jgi:hypothetical protein